MFFFFFFFFFFIPHNPLVFIPLHKKPQKQELDPEGDEKRRKLVSQDTSDSSSASQTPSVSSEDTLSPGVRGEPVSQYPSIIKEIYNIFM